MSAMDPRAVGVFDSGVGGLTVLHECLVTMPNEDFVYLGDDARCRTARGPLTRSARFALEIAPTSRRPVVKLILVACNPRPRPRCRCCRRATVPVVGVLTPEARAAVQATRNRRIGVLATEATVEAAATPQAVHLLDAGVHVVEVACPKLVPLIEAGAPVELLVDAVREYAAPLRTAGADTVILGCTHYPLIRPVFERVFGRDVTLIFSAEETAREIAETLARKGIANERAREGCCRFLTTGSPEEFRGLGERFLQLPIGDVGLVGLADLERAAA